MHSLSQKEVSKEADPRFEKVLESMQETACAPEPFSSDFIDDFTSSAMAEHTPPVRVEWWPWLLCGLILMSLGGASTYGFIDHFTTCSAIEEAVPALPPVIRALPTLATNKPVVKKVVLKQESRAALHHFNPSLSSRAHVKKALSKISLKSKAPYRTAAAHLHKRK